MAARAFPIAGSTGKKTAIVLKEADCISCCHSDTWQLRYEPADGPFNPDPVGFMHSRQKVDRCASAETTSAPRVARHSLVPGIRLLRLCHRCAVDVSRHVGGGRCHALSRRHRSVLAGRRVQSRPPVQLGARLDRGQPRPLSRCLATDGRRPCPLLCGRGRFEAVSGLSTQHGSSPCKPISLPRIILAGSHSFAGQLARLLHPGDELSFVEFVLVDVEVAHVLVLGRAGRDRTAATRRGRRSPSRIS